MKRVSFVAMALLTSCQSDRPFPKIVLGPEIVEPVWSSYIGCSGGIELSQGALSVARRIVDEYEIWKFDATSGTLLNYATKPSRIGGAPHDTPADLTAGSTKPRSFEGEILDSIRVHSGGSHGSVPLREEDEDSLTTAQV